MLANPINVFSVELYPDRQSKLGDTPSILQYNTLTELSNQYVESVLSEISLSDNNLVEINSVAGLAETYCDDFSKKEEVGLISSGLSFPKTFCDASEYLLKCNKPCPTNFPESYTPSTADFLYERRITHYTIGTCPFFF